MDDDSMAVRCHINVKNQTLECFIAKKQFWDGDILSGGLMGSQKLREVFNLDFPDNNFFHKTLTVVSGPDVVDLTFHNFVSYKENVGKDWADDIMAIVRNPFTYNASRYTFLEKILVKLKMQLNTEGKIPVRNHSKAKPYMTKDHLTQFINKKQRDSHLNDMLSPPAKPEQVQRLIEKYEPSVMNVQRGQLSPEGMVWFLCGPENSIVSQDKLLLYQDMNQPLSHYFINSSHNTYLTAGQFSGISSPEMYRQTLLTGCRCVELDCWKGRPPDEEPIITHGFTMTTEILFKDAIEAIAESAFKTSPYPVILSFENHVDSPKQQAKMAEYCRTIFGDMLLTEPLEKFPLKPGVPLPSPQDLMGKILIKNKKNQFISGENQDTLKKGKDPEDEVTDQTAPTESNSTASSGEVAEEIPEAEGDLENLDEEEIKKLQSDEGTAGLEVTAYEEMSSLVNYIQPIKFESFEVSSHVPMQQNMALFEFNGQSGYLLKHDFMRRPDKQFDPFSVDRIDVVVASTLSITILMPELASLRIVALEEGGKFIGQRIIPVTAVRTGYHHVCLRSESNMPLTMPSLFVYVNMKDYVPDSWAEPQTASIEELQEIKAFGKLLKKQEKELKELERKMIKRREELLQKYAVLFTELVTQPGKKKIPDTPKAPKKKSDTKEMKKKLETKRLDKIQIMTKNTTDKGAQERLKKEINNAHIQEVVQIVKQMNEKQIRYQQILETKQTACVEKIKEKENQQEAFAEYEGKVKTLNAEVQDLVKNCVKVCFPLEADMTKEEVLNAASEGNQGPDEPLQGNNLRPENLNHEKQMAENAKKGEESTAVQESRL
ncbi:hypothetical protein JD844_021223 [Phrynosoma platyrhinos]|uniref:Phosphoinositide phospholipase C n=1 Tax=Phrynosoma platyrhinos TaxID=52577 RepID=A0ABQ7ST94_PHRPL|nr:hypothetical protein JD844_021223 [Phrynosoma platyrhinos]